MGRLKYDSNNSGGDWWLSDSDWYALETAGWDVEWRSQSTDYLGKPDKNGRWLGALATKASKEVSSANEGIAEWERITNESADDLGCSCCGPPHNFEYVDAGGETFFASAKVVESSLEWV